MNRMVLVVDDDPTIRTILQDYLETLGFTIFHATDGHTGWEIYQRQRPCLVIADIFMPGMTGVELLEKIKSDEHPAPVVLISGVQLSDVEMQMQRERADAFLEKPYMFWQMKELIAKLLPDVNLPG
ncbi:MAG: response regulator [Candidatus Zixiibacteriota bacterium]|nr:MAG: response regulator [candidate division Zixibacteria bacterium]